MNKFCRVVSVILGSWLMACFRTYRAYAHIRMYPVVQQNLQLNTWLKLINFFTDNFHSVEWRRSCSFAVSCANRCDIYLGIITLFKPWTLAAKRSPRGLQLYSCESVESFSGGGYCVCDPALLSPWPRHTVWTIWSHCHAPWFMYAQNGELIELCVGGFRIRLDTNWGLWNGDTTPSIFLAASWGVYRHLLRV